MDRLMDQSQQGPIPRDQRSDLTVDPLTWTVLPASPRLNLLFRFSNLSSPSRVPRNPRYEQIGSLKSRLLELR